VERQKKVGRGSAAAAFRARLGKFYVVNNTTKSAPNKNKQIEISGSTRLGVKELYVYSSLV
jgi:hypothetical protein